VVRPAIHSLTPVIQGISVLFEDLVLWD
jgi:hypothetical protein